MLAIISKEILNSSTISMMVKAPLIARKAEPGQFVILRVDENGERIPLTIYALTAKMSLSFTFLP